MTLTLQQIHKGSGATIKGGEKVARAMKQADDYVEKSLNTAVRVEGFRLKNLLQRQIRAGAPGGRQFAPLTHIAKKIDTRPAGRKPLTRLALGVRYQVMDNDPFHMAVGFVGPQTGFDARMALYQSRFGRGIISSHVVSKSWRRLAHFHQQGFSSRITQSMRRLLVGRGAHLGTVEGGDTPFFLKKTTKRFTTPARPVIDPFWMANRRQANQNIEKNFKRKLKGIRI